MNLYPVARALCYIIFPLTIFPHVVVGKEHLNPDEPVIYCANHRHFYDPFLLAIFVRKPIRFMAKKELFAHKLLAWALDGLGAFAVDRKRADVASIRHAVSTLEKGEHVGIFPEGTRNTDSFGMGEIHAGAAWIALKADVSIVPAFIDSRGLWRQTRIFVGEKIDFALEPGTRINAAIRDEAAKKLSDAMLELETIAENWSKN